MFVYAAFDFMHHTVVYAASVTADQYFSSALAFSACHLIVNLAHLKHSISS